MVQTKYINLIYLSKNSKKSEISGSSRLAETVGAKVIDEMTFHKGQLKIFGNWRGGKSSRGRGLEFTIIITSVRFDVHFSHYFSCGGIFNKNDARSRIY